MSTNKIFKKLIYYHSYRDVNPLRYFVYEVFYVLVTWKNRAWLNPKMNF